MTKFKKLNKLLRDPRKFFIDALGKRSRKSSLARKSKKLLENPSLFISDYIQKRSALQKKLEKYSATIPLGEYHFQLYSKYKSLNYNARAEDALLTAIKLKKKPEYYHELGMRLKQKKQWWQAAEAFANATELSTKTNPSWHKEYAFILTRMGRHADAARAWKHALSQGSKSANDWFSFGYALSLSNQKEASDDAHEKAIEFDKKMNSQKLGIGIFYEKLGHWKPASLAYKKHLLLNPLDADVHYKVGLALDRCYQWEDAEKSYVTAISLAPGNIHSYYSLGFVRERQGKYLLATEAYAYAAEHRKNHTPYWYYRLGFVLNKAGKYKESCEAFLMMKKIVLANEQSDAAPIAPSNFPLEETKPLIQMSKVDVLEYLIDEKTTKSDVAHLLRTEFGKTGDDIDLWKLFFNKESYKENVFEYLLQDMNQAEKETEKAEQEAEKLRLEITLLETTLASDSTRTDLWYKLAKSCELVNDLEKAISAYKNLIARKEHFDGDLYYSLGHLLALQEKHAEAAEAFMEQRIMQDAHGMTEAPYSKDAGLNRIVNYTKYYEAYALEEKTILYESFHGASLSGNPYSIFCALLSDNRFEGHKHIWVVNDKRKIPEELKGNSQAIFIRRNSDAYMRYLAKAKFLINNVSFPEYFIRKEGQIYLNTWHGTPVKSLGKDIKDDFLSHKNVSRNFLQASHLIQPNSYTTEILLDKYGVKNIATATVAETGYPRQDLMLNVTKAEKVALQGTLNISNNITVVLYAPTWRGTHGKAVFDASRLEKDLKALGSAEGVQLLFRGHHMTEKLLGDIYGKATVVPPNIDTNTLLSVVDILITDYSSIAFDYMALEKPIIYYAYDKEEYEEERGLYFPLEDLGGHLCTTEEELLSSLNEITRSPAISGKQIEAQKKFCPYDDGRATQRVIDLIFFDKKEHAIETERSSKESILFYGGPFIPNGIITSCINLLNHIDTNRYAVSIALEPDLVKKDPQRIKQLGRLNKNINILGRAGRMLMSLEEKWVIEKFDSQNILASDEMYEIYTRAYVREFKRMFGEGAFDSTVNFEGYNTFWMALFATKQKSTHTNSVYLHNDMHGEWTLRFPYLEKNFRAYKSYDSIVSVSQKTMERNIQNLSHRFSLCKTKFTYCDNVQNPKSILKLALKSFENKLDERVFKGARVFINIARLSPEKDQEKLIRAFATISKEFPNARLVNLGSGPIEHDLRHVINELGLEKKVFLLGQKSNPYPYLKRADCFVMSSNHEGQPMTLLEAMILEKPIIATDITGNRSVVEGRSGHLVANSEAGLAQGMRDFLEGKYDHNKTFDYETYNKNSLNMFYEKVTRT